jgi:outer membrane immunogenic protein
MIDARFWEFDWSVAMRRFLLAVMIFGAVSGARGADMPDIPILRGTQGLSSARVNWQGFYVGGQAGLGTSDMNFANVTQSLAAQLLFDTAIDNAGGVSGWPLGSKTSTHGNGWGGFVGYNSQWDDVVLSAELSYMHGKFGGAQTDSLSRSFTDSSGANDAVTYTAFASVNLTDMASARLRAGYAWGIFLPYVFGGAAFGQADIVRTATISGTQTLGGVTVPFSVSLTDAQNSHFVFGYAGGLGVDVMLISCLFLRGEWEYARYSSRIDTQVNTVRVGLGYKF